MSHQHDHAAMMASTTPLMNHDHHMMNHSTDTSAVSTGHGFHMKDMMMMAMTFHGGYKEQILFDQWNTKTTSAFVASWFAVFFFAVLYEALKTFRDALARRDICATCTQTENRQQTVVHPDDHQEERPGENDLLSPIRIENHRINRARLLSVSHLIQTLLHILQMALSYLLMLVAMTFNIYLFFAIVLGAGLGHFLFGWRRSSVIDYNEHCH
ncbi:unnamed protein product [Rotaria sp. Silwood1]|nr:unnamed protein product [Rotaria sp. Silwood1]CAF3590575.1 unnamed protein product [Rotaria sp. Silwood1]CAF3600120.1 unnamed protein product [Rotaria sp. Silwood1]CAF4711887.1 unnamed protein product [Rotaria sp. Silwood1]CAF4904154.1 unnamed protein product [Rotaria sp. Silwood1]